MRPGACSQPLNAYKRVYTSKNGYTRLGKVAFHAVFARIRKSVNRSFSRSRKTLSLQEKDGPWNEDASDAAHPIRGASTRNSAATTAGPTTTTTGGGSGKRNCARSTGSCRATGGSSPTASATAATDFQPQNWPPATSISGFSRPSNSHFPDDAHSGATTFRTKSADRVPFTSGQTGRNKGIIRTFVK